MIASILVALLFATDRPVQAPPVVTPTAACKLTRADHIQARKSYSISGHYMSDGMHGSMLEIPRCNDVIWPNIVGNASTAVAAFHDAFQRKCGVYLMGDEIDGVFTGAFVRRKAQLFGMSSPMMINFFQISDIQTKDLDVNSISCPK